MARIEIGKYLAADTRICGGRLIFRGTRVLVSDALELAAAGYAPEAIAEQYRAILTPSAVREALTLTSQGMIREIVKDGKPPRDHSGSQYTLRSGETTSQVEDSLSADRF